MTQLILIIEDDSDIADAVEEILVGEGYGALRAATGAEAFELLERHGPPALIVLDLLMPGMNGIEFLAALRRDPRVATVAVIVTTASRVEVVPTAQRLLHKPYDLETLLEVVRELCPLNVV